jgi:hypothetical protein
MSSNKPFLTPFRTAFDPEIGLYLPLIHLLGKRIALFLERGNQLDISYWKFDPESALGKTHTGRVHIVPTLLESELSLIEDLILSEPPQDFPRISERTTSSREVNISLLYPLSMENWNFRIHYNQTMSLIDDIECKFLIAEGRLRNSLSDRFCFEDSQKEVYSPPRTLR